MEECRQLLAHPQSHITVCVQCVGKLEQTYMKTSKDPHTPEQLGAATSWKTLVVGCGDLQFPGVAGSMGPNELPIVVDAPFGVAM